MSKIRVCNRCSDKLNGHSYYSIEVKSYSKMGAYTDRESYEVDLCGKCHDRFNEFLRELAPGSEAMGIMSKDIIPPNCTIIGNMRTANSVLKLGDIHIYTTTTFSVNQKKWWKRLFNIDIEET